MKQMIATMHFVHGRFERAVESARKTGAISTRIWHSKQLVYIINMVHDVKTRVASNHEMKFNTNIVWNARGIAKPGLTCAWACMFQCQGISYRKVKWCISPCALTGFTGAKGIDHWNVSFICGLQIVSTFSSEEVLETTSQHLNLLKSPGA